MEKKEILVKDLFIEDGIFRGTTNFKDGYEFTFDVTREQIIRFLLDHRKGRLCYASDGTTMLDDKALLRNYIEQQERVYHIERKKANPSSIGGHRDGAGRKPKDKVATQVISVPVRKDFLELIINNFPNRSEYIQHAIKNQLKRDGLI
ncbi:MAG: hypothetical protein K6D91_06165 [Prevotella sp.]|nr:hypothetical protein [Prevotella sp.]